MVDVAAYSAMPPKGNIGRDSAGWKRPTAVDCVFCQAMAPMSSAAYASPLQSILPAAMPMSAMMPKHLEIAYTTSDGYPIVSIHTPISKFV